MGMSLKSGRQRSRRHAMMSEINITPFVDVVLVLLIVFMVTAPLVTSGVRVDLPTGARKTLQAETQPVIISLTADGSIYIQDQRRPTPSRQLVAKIDALVSGKRDERIFLRADHSLTYADVMAIMALLADAGFSRVGLVSNPTSPHTESLSARPSDRHLSMLDGMSQN